MANNITKECFQDLFESVVRRFPENIAISKLNERVTYKELDKRAGMLANYLCKIGVNKERRVGIICDRNIETMIGIVAVLKAGGAYVPIDPTIPSIRKKYIINDCMPIAILGSSSFENDINVSIPIIDLFDKQYYIEEQKKITKNSSSDLAAIYYTSGTTGIPKGVTIEHNRFIKSIIFYEENIILTSNDVILQFASLSFIASFEEMTMSLLIGAELCLIPYDVILDYKRFEHYISEHGISVAILPPGYLTNFDALNIRTLLVGGASSINNVLSHISKSTQYYNIYGTTEIGFVTYWKQLGKIEQKNVPIGKANNSTTVYILFNNKPCAVMEPGELCITGLGIARGYLNHPKLTEEKFIKNPYGEGRMYKTGDLACWLPDGNIEYLGRIDDQVKIRGFRVELGEIESTLRSLSGIKDAAVIAREDANGDKNIYAYVVSDEVVSIRSIRGQLGKMLPDYMVPPYMMQIEKLPLTSNRKLDRSALPEIEARCEGEYVAPSDQKEANLCHIFRDILGIEKVGVRDNFFELGGHSLRAMRVINAIESESGVRLPLNMLFTHPTVAGLAQIITEEQGAYKEIPMAEDREYYPMSSTQKRMYLIYQNGNQEIAYNMPQGLRLRGAVDPKKIKTSLEELIRRHEILRTEFIMLAGEPVQHIQEQVDMDFIYTEDNNLTEEELFAGFIQPFDLGKAPLLRAKVVKRKEECLLLVDMHHIVCDGMSMGTFIRELSMLYNEREIKAVPRQYKDYSEWMRTRDLSQQQKYWADEFSAEIPILNMPLDYRRPKEQSFEGEMIYEMIEEELYGSLNTLSQETGTTIYMILLSAAMIELSRYSHQEDIVVGSPVSARVHKDTENMLGMFVNTLAMRGKPEGKKRYLDFLMEIKEKCLKAYENQEYPFEELVEAVEVQRDLSRNPLFDVMLVLQNNEEGRYQFDGVDIDYLVFKDKISKFDLTFNISGQGEGLEIGLEYCTALYKEDSARSILRHFIVLLGEIVKAPETLIEEMEMITPKERNQILFEFNNANKDYSCSQTVVELFEEQVERTPDLTALVYEGKEMTYQELNRKANQLASRLRELGVGPNDFVAIIGERSIEMIIGICGIIKSQGVYVPIDMSYPSEHIAYIIKDCRPKAIMTLDFSINTNIPIIDLKDQLSYGKQETSLQESISPESILYCIYTSGTTGKPKGSLIEHKSVIRLVKNPNYVELDYNTVILQTGSIAFDASTLEIWGALLNGGKLVLADIDVLLDSYKLENYIKTYQVNTMWLTSALFNQVVQTNPGAFDRLSYLLIGGDKLSEVHVRALKKCNSDTILINGYGPTENTTFTTTFEIPTEFSTISIGQPINNTQVYILNNMKLCGILIPGELCTTGDGVAFGYLNQPELTAEKFVKNPYGEGRMYKTGDLARWLPDGNIEYLGRMDDQVKIRGFRIELGEIETALRRLAGIKDAAVIAREDTYGNKNIYAYVVSDNAVSISSMRRQLGETLPDYMVPPYMIQIETLPLTSNGKLDKRALPEIEAKSEMEYTAPANPVETALCRVFEEVLGIHCVGTGDNFFELGGDSIKAIRIVSKVREYGYDIKIKDVMQKPVVESLARVCSGVETAHYEQEEVTGQVIQTPIIREYGRWGLTRPEHFNQSVMLSLEDDVDEGSIKEALSCLAVHHDILRSVYCDGSLEILGVKNSRLYDYQIIHAESKTKEQVEAECTQIQESIDLLNGPLMKAALIRDEQKKYLLIVLHHLVVDGVSWRILTEDFHTALAQIKKGKPVTLPAKTASYREWAQALEEYKNSDILRSEYAYWSREVKATEEGRIPRGVCKEKGYGNVKIEFSLPETERLVRDSRRAFTTEINDMLLSALGMAVCQVTGQEKAAVFLEGHGREEIHRKINIDRTVGWFTSIYPMVLECTDDMEQMICTTKDKMRSIPNHGIGYGLLQDKLGNDGADIYFNYLGEMDAEYKSNPVPYSCGMSNAGQNRMNGSINMNGSITGGKLCFELSYDKSMIPDEMAKRLSGVYKNSLNRLVDFCIEQKETRKTASDYRAQSLTTMELRTIEGLIQKWWLIEDIYELTPLQEGMLFHKLQDTESSRYVVQTVYKTDARLDADNMQEAFRLLSQKHDVLRTAIIYEKLSKPYQVILKERHIEYQEIDLSGFGEEERKKRTDEIVKEDVRRGFDLDEDSLLRITYIRDEDVSGKLIWSMHHIIVDGWCLPVLISDFWSYYEMLQKGSSIIEVEKRVVEEKKSIGKYGEYVSWLEKQDKAAAIDYWKKRLSGYEGIARIEPMCKGEDVNETFKIKEIQLSEDLTKALQVIAVKNEVTMNTVAETAWELVLQCYNASDDAVFGKVISGRNANIYGIEKIVGLFINTIPCRVSIRKGLCMNELLKEMQNRGSEEMAYSYSSLAEIQKETIQGGDLIQTLFVFENYYIDETAQENLSLMKVASVREETNYAITVITFIFKDQLYIRLLYNPRESCAFDITLLSDRMVKVLGNIAKDSQAPVENMEIITLEEHNQILYEFNHTDREYSRSQTVVELFEEQVERTPDLTALVFEGKEITYRELNRKANQLAVHLRELGVGSNDLVAIIAERSIEMIIGISGIIKSGGAYVPIDSSYPAGRIQYILDDCHPKAILVYHMKVETDVPVIDLGSSFMTAFGNPVRISGPEDLVYCLYTSGTTGQPKGVMVEHRTLYNLIMCEYNYIKIPKIKKAAFITNICFDVATQEIFSTLLSGGTGIIIDRQKQDINQCRSIFTEYKIDTLFTTPTYFDLLAGAFNNEGDSYLKQIHLAGEKFYIDTKKAQKVIDSCDKIYNHYGPTETHCATYKEMSYREVEEGDGKIGIPYGNTQIYIIREGRLCGFGIPGELCIAGRGLARGYLNRPKLTEEKFIKNPYGEGRIYKTGDLARWLPDGNIEYLGRIDDQVKIRGFRVELGEIENTLRQLTGIKDAVVVSQEVSGGDRNIYAYIVSAEEVNTRHVSEQLGRILPDYMVPSYIMQIERLPLTNNGKLDKRALPAIKVSSAREYAAPRNQTESALCQIFKTLLDVERVGIKDNFFELGGHSLKAIKLEVEINKLFNNVTVKDIYKFPTIEYLSHHINNECWNGDERNDTNSFIQKKGEENIALNIIPFNNINYKGCFYNSLFSLLQSININIYKYMVDDVIFYHYQRGIGLLESKYLERNSLLDLLREDNIQVNTERNCKNIISKIIEALDERKPVIIYYDPYYIPIRLDAYKKTHMNHSILINGYSREDELFYVIEHKNWESLIYEQLAISFSDLRNAYQHGVEVNENEVTYFEFTIKKSIPITRKYLQAEYRQMIVENKEIIYKGIDMLKTFILDYEKIVLSEEKAQAKGKEYLEIFSRIINAKQVEKYRIKYLFEDNFELIASINKIIEMWEKTRTYIGRYVFSGFYKKKDMFKSTNVLKDISAEEEILLKKLLSL